jgi:membrane protease YdiL (CAAX protease family)
MVADNALIRERISQRPMSRMVYAVVFLIVSTAAFVELFMAFDHHLILTNQISRSVNLDEHPDLFAAIFTSLNLFVAILIAGVPQDDPVPSPVYSLVSSGAWGVFGASSAFLLAVPFLLLEKHSTVARFLANNLYNFGGLAFLGVTLIALPIASEFFFRRIVFWETLKRTSLVPAVLATVLLYGIVWPLFSPFAAIAFGLVSCILFYRTRSVFACIVANSFFTLFCAGFLLWRLLQSS